MAINVFSDLEMIELVQGEIYRVKNFAKHQNIKVKEKVDLQENERNAKNNQEERNAKSEESTKKQLVEDKNTDLSMASEQKTCNNIDVISEKQSNIDKFKNSKIANNNKCSSISNIIEINKDVKDTTNENEMKSDTQVTLKKKKSKKGIQDISCFDG